ncbi:hypothetical protein Z046_29310 [Pseudomonas aeruginosa VRFPA09]|nr:hypothetical protein Z046_29310 [Pseudomonas aeruginosa VRFPA09]
MALVAQALRNAFVDCRAFLCIAIRALGLDYDQRNAIDEANDIRPARFHTAAAEHAKFFSEDKTVVGWIVPVDQRHGWAGLFTIHELRHRDAIQQMVIEPFVCSHQSFIECRAAHFTDQVVDSFCGKRVLTASKQEAPLTQLLTQHITQHHFIALTGPRSQSVLG